MTTTYTGVLLLPNNYGVPSPTDLAVQLGRLPRFAGATRVWWSVLHHIRFCHKLWALHPACSHLKSSQPFTEIEVARALLLHDADETASSDVPTLWKPPELRAWARRLQERTFLAYMGSIPGPAVMEYVKRIDLLALRMEAELVGPPGVLVHSGLGRGNYPDGVRDRAMTAMKEIHDSYGVNDPLSSACPDSPLVRWYYEAVTQLCNLSEPDIDRMEGQ